MRKIATEEAFSIPEVALALKQVVRGPSSSLDKLLVKGIYDSPGGGSGYGSMNFLEGLMDIEGHRLQEMNELGVDMHLLSLTAPGVQMFDADTATELAALANDRLAEVCRRHPTRFAGLASFAPQSPKRAAREMERAIRTLKLNGFILNSHTNGEYLDDPKLQNRWMPASIFIHAPHRTR
jgi:5-carboxyvanillate decarboxylase